MKFKFGFLLAMTLIVSLSLGAIAASDDANFYTSHSDDIDLDIDLIDSPDYVDGNSNGELVQSPDNSKLSSPADDVNQEEDVDLSVNMDVNVSYVDEQYNKAGSEVPWTITVSVNNGIAYNTKVREVLSTNLQYLSHEASVGVYDPSTGIWDIGDLDSSNNASLTILTILKKDGTFMNKAYATTDSKDKNLLNNYVFLSIKTGSSKITSNITETSDDREGPQHKLHYASMYDFDFSEFEEEELSENEDNPNPNPNPNNNNGSDSNGGGDSQPSNNSSALPSNDGSFSTPFSKVFSPLNTPINEVLGSSLNPKKTFFNLDFDVPYAYDYTRIPIMIFALFLIILFGNLAYDKLKS